MQVFIKKGDLAKAGSVVVYGAYPDAQVVAADLHGADKQIMRVPDSSVRVENALMVMDQGWRTDPAGGALVVDYEANRRINLSFPPDTQRAASALVNQYITTYGPDQATWPAAVKANKAEIDAGWNYVVQVNQTAAAMKQTTLPTDPTSDAHWPTVIPPVDLAL